MTSPTVDRRFGLVGNAALKAPVAAVATANITLSGQQTIDGVALLATNAASVADRVLCVGQTDATQNGIWDVSTAAWSRSKDADGPYDFVKGSQVLVGGGTLNNLTVWCLTTTPPITVGSSSLTWQLAIGASLGNFVQGGSGAVARTFTSKDRDAVSVFDFMTAAQVSDVQAGTLTQNVTLALYNAAQYIQTLGGGTLFFPPGKYLVGLQTIRGTLLDGITPCAYGPHEIITIKNCTKPVRLIGCGAVIKAADGLKYGSFDRTTGLRFNPGAFPFTDYNYYGYPYRAMINVEGNESVVIEGFELDGNNTKLTLGGYWGDSQWQLEGHGIWDSTNNNVQVRNVYVHNQPADGGTIIHTGLTEASVPRPHLYENLRSRYNGRLGMSIVGGIQITLINPDLSNTGLALNTVTSELVQSSPGAGIDIEAESSVVRDVSIINPHIVGNWTKGFIAASGDSRRVTVKGGKIENAVLARAQYHFEDVLFLGFTDVALAATDPYTLATITEEVGYRFTRCHFSYDATQTESGALVNSSQSTWAEALYSVWDTCTINTGTVLLPAAFKSPLAANSMVWKNCYWRSSNTGGHGSTGHFQGTNIFNLTGGGATLATAFGSASQIDYGTVTLNGVGIGGGTVAQITSKATGVTLNTQRGQITTFNDALGAATTVSFTLTNSAIGANDDVVCHRKSGGTAAAYQVWVDSVAAGTCVISIRNITGGGLAEALVLQFAVVPGAIT